MIKLTLKISRVVVSTQRKYIEYCLVYTTHKQHRNVYDSNLSQTTLQALISFSRKWYEVGLALSKCFFTFNQLWLIWGNGRGGTSYTTFTPTRARSSPTAYIPSVTQDNDQTTSEPWDPCGDLCVNRGAVQYGSDSVDASAPTFL